MINSEKRFVLILLLLLPPVAAFLSSAFHVNFFISICLFYLLPSVVLSILAPRHIKQTLIFATMTGMIYDLIVDTIASRTGVWFIPHTLLPWRFFGVVTGESLLGVIAQNYFIIIFYKFLMDETVSEKPWPPRAKYLAAWLTILFSAFLILNFGFPHLLNIPHWYVCFGIALGYLPTLAILLMAPEIRGPLLKTGAYFFYLGFIYEITAVKLGWWVYPGDQYIGWITAYGTRFPAEEMVFWMATIATTMLAHYRLFFYEAAP